MEHATQVQLGRKLLDQLDAGSTALAEDIYRNPVSDYTCAEQAALERTLFFREHPLVMGLSCDAAKPGDYFTNEFAGTPVLVVRGDDGRLNAFLNVCRHRGSRVAQGCGQGRKVFACPYHAWSYDREGRLVAIPEGYAFEGVDRETHGLRRLPVVEKYGLVWVRPTPGPDFDPDDLLGGLAPEMAAYGFEGYHHYETRILRRRMNWKLVLDTFLETYHLKVLHKETIAPILHSNCMTFDGFGRNLRMGAPRKTIDALRTIPEADWDVIRYTAVIYILFPNVALNMLGDHLETWRVYPAGNGTDESVMEVSLYTPEPALTESARGHWARNMDLLMATVEQEDFAVGEGIQDGFRSGAQTHVTYGRNEPSLAHFHRSIRQALGLETD